MAFKRITGFLLLLGYGYAQTPTQVDFLNQVKNKFGYIVSSNANNTNGGYIVFPPVTYNPYDNVSTCFDLWNNAVQQPLPAAGQPAFGVNDLVLWNSLSPSLQFAAGTGTYGLVQKMLVTTPATTNTGPCGIPLRVNTDYGINTNGYFFGRGGLATDNPMYNSIQSLQGGILANSFTAGTLYRSGTTVCTTMVGASCTATTMLGVDTYLGGHMDTGHSKGPPQLNSILASTNPFSGAEGLVAGQVYYDDNAHCEEVYSGSSWGCIGAGVSGMPAGADTQVQFNSMGAFGANTNFSWNNTTGDLMVCTALGGICTATSGVDAQAFSSSATGAAVAFTDVAGNFTIRGSGQANFNTLNVGAGSPFSVDVTGNLTVASCSGCGGGGGGSTAPLIFNGLTSTPALSAPTNANMYYNTSSQQFLVSYNGAAYTGLRSPVFNCTETGGTNCMQQAAGDFHITGAGDAFFQSLTLTAGLTAGGVLTAPGLSVTSANIGSGGLAITGGSNLALGALSDITSDALNTISGSGNVRATGTFTASGLAGGGANRPACISNTGTISAGTNAAGVLSCP